MYYHPKFETYKNAIKGVILKWLVILRPEKNTTVSPYIQLPYSTRDRSGAQGIKREGAEIITTQSQTIVIL